MAYSNPIQPPGRCKRAVLPNLWRLNDPQLTARGAPCALACLATAATAPKLYVYEGTGGTGSANLPKFKGMLGRKVDRVVDFNEYTQTPPNALSNLNRLLGCWQ